MNKFRTKYIGDAQLYKYALALAIPMILQNMITNFVSMLDNIMVGQIGTASMSGVSIVNQFMFVFNLTVFGGISGAGIFGTQFFGKGDPKGQKYTVRFRLLLVGVLILVGLFVFSAFGTNLINVFLSQDDTPQMIKETLGYGLQYLSIMKWTLIPFGIGQAYSSVVRECGETKIPMFASLAAIGVNLVLDYGLIFGKLGMPCMGVRGAAIATMIAKIVEAAVVVIWAHTHPERNLYIKGLYRGFYIPSDLAKNIILKGCPLLVNEFMWSLGMSVIAQSYSVRGIEVVAARNIAMTLVNLFSMIFIQFGAAIGIIVGARLGAAKFDEAKDVANKLAFLAVVVTLGITIVVIPISIFFPGFYNTEASVKSLAAFYIIIQAIAMPMQSYSNACYFILRSGGRTGITFLFDFIFTWFIMIPTAFILTRYSGMEIHLLMAIVTYTELIKDVVGYFLLRSELWVRNIVE